MTRRLSRTRATALSVAVALLVAACGGGSDDDSSATQETSATSQDSATASAPNAAADAAATCPIDEAELSDAIGIAMTPLDSARCGFEAASPEPGQVIEVYYTPIDAMVFDGSEGEEVAGIGDGARWDTQMADSLLVQTGSRHFSIQAVAMGDLPEDLQPRNLATTVAKLVLAG